MNVRMRRAIHLALWQGLAEHGAKLFQRSIGIDQIVAVPHESCFRLRRMNPEIVTSIIRLGITTFRHKAVEDLEIDRGTLISARLVFTP